MVTKKTKRSKTSISETAEPKAVRADKKAVSTLEGNTSKSLSKKTADTATNLCEGARMPLAKLFNQDGKIVNLADYIGHPLVVYFYPKDDTPGCTREACSFQENAAALKKLKVTVVGISADSVVKHRKFADKYGIRFPLLVDEDKSYMTTCGVIGEKVLYGKRSLGIIRTTFVVDKSGKIHRIFRKVKVDGHTEEVLAALKELQ